MARAGVRFLRGWLLASAWLVLVGLAFAAFRGTTGTATDFDVYYDAAQAVRSGDSPYTFLGTLRRTYVYPPFLACALVPLSWLPRDGAAALWGVWNVAALGGCLLLLRRLLESLRHGRLVAAGSLLLVTPFLLNALRTGQVGVLLLFLALLALRPGVRDVPAAGALALGTSVKLYPAFAGAHWLLERRWRRAAIAAAIFAGLAGGLPLLALGPGGAVDAWVDYASAFLLGAPGDGDVPAWFGYRGSNSQSLVSAVYRWTTDPSAQDLAGAAPWTVALLPVPARWVVTGAMAAALLAAYLLAHRRADAGDVRTRPLIQIALTLGLIPILSPIALKNTFVFLWPLTAAILCGPLAAFRRHRAAAVMALGGVLLHVFPVSAVLGEQAGRSANANSSVLVGAVLLYAGLVAFVLGEGSSGLRSPGIATAGRRRP